MDNLQDYFGIILFVNLILSGTLFFALLSWIRVNNERGILIKYQIKEYESIESDEVQDEA